MRTFLSSMMGKIPALIVLQSVWLLFACSSSVPVAIRQAPEQAPDIAQLRASPQDYPAQQVRWGGRILSTQNKQDATWITIVAMPLSKRGEPLKSDQSPGRFIAIVKQFVEPLVYRKNRLITVTGRYLRAETHQVGEFQYSYPLIEVDQYYLWPRKVKSPVTYPQNFWRYDPWSYPYYPNPYNYYRIRGELICDTQLCS